MSRDATVIGTLLIIAVVLAGLLFLPANVGGGLIYADGSFDDIDAARAFLIILLFTSIGFIYLMWRGVRAIEAVAANPTLPGLPEDIDVMAKSLVLILGESKKTNSKLDGASLLVGEGQA